MTDVAPIEPGGSVGAALTAADAARVCMDFSGMIGLSMMAVRCQLWLGPLVLAGLLPCEQALAQAQFSADLTSRQGDAAAPAGRLSVIDGKVRLETPELADGFFLIDGAKPSAYFVRPASRVYMEARQSSRLTRLFVPVDPYDPCRQWQTMARLAGVADQADWHCERIGEDVIGGRPATAYRAVSAASEQILGWIDPEYRFPLQIKTQDGAVITAENIRDIPASAQPLEIPQGFRKFDPELLIERIKQSDVWVAP
jgi:hypothetical protein